MKDRCEDCKHYKHLDDDETGSPSYGCELHQSEIEDNNSSFETDNCVDYKVI